MNRRNERLNVPVNRNRPNLAGNRRPQLGGCHQNGEYNPYTVYQLRKQQLHASNCSNLINGKAEVRRNSNGESSESSSTSIIGLLSKIDHNQEFEPQMLQTPVMQSQQVQTHQLHYMPSLGMQQQQQMQSPMMQQADMQTQTASPVISTVASNTSDEIFFRKVAEFHKENENFLNRRRAENLGAGQTASLTSRFEMPPKIPPRLNRASLLRMQHLEQRQEYYGRSTNLLKFGTDPFKPKQMPVREEAAQTALEVYRPQLVSRIVFKPNDATVGAPVQCETLELGLTPNVAGIAAGTQTLNIPPRARGRPRMSERERAKQMLRHSVSPQLRRANVERNRKARLQRPGKKPMKTESMFTLTSTSNIAVNILPKFPRKPQPRKPKKRPIGKELAKRKNPVKRLQRDRPKQLIPKDDEIPKGSPKCKPRTRMKKPPKKLPYKNIGAARKKANNANNQRQKTMTRPNTNIEANVENVQGQRGNGRTRAGGGMDEHTARFLQREREKFLEKHLGRRYLETHHCLENSANHNQRRPLHMSKNLKGLDATTMLRWGMRRAPLQTKAGATFIKTPRKKRLLKKVIVKPKPNTRQHFTMPKMKDPRTGSWVPAFKNMDEYLQTIYAPSQYILLEKRRIDVKCPVCMKLHKPGSSLRYALAISKKPTFLL